MEKLTQHQAAARISALLAENEVNIEKAVALADEYGIDFYVESPSGAATSRYVPQNGKRPTIEQYWENEGYGDEPGENGIPEDWDWTYAGWQNSSTFC